MDDLAAIFAEAGCTGQLCVRSHQTGREVALAADEPATPASTIKVLVAVEAESRFADGRLDPCQHIVLSSAKRTLGPVGFSLYEDDVEVSLRDLTVAMLTLSDNVATDALIGLVGVDACNETARRLGLGDTLLVGDIGTMIDGIAADAGFPTWREFAVWSEESSPSAEERATVEARIPTARAFDTRIASRTTARDMCLLLEAIWNDTAAPPEACHRIRRLMGEQLTRHRLATGFPPPARVAAKSGGLLGQVRNEVGVVAFPDGEFLFVAVFTRTTGGNDTAINAAIGRAAAAAARQIGVPA